MQKFREEDQPTAAARSPEHASSYFVPIPAGSTSATIDFTADDWYTQSAGLWAEGMKAHPQSLGPAAGRAVRPKERASDRLSALHYRLS